MEFSFVINNTRLSSTENKIPYTGNVNSYRCLFDIHSDIEGLAWFCVFAVGEDCYVQQIIDNACYIPHEVLVSENKIKLGCYATNMSQDDYKRVSTNWLYFKSLAGAYTEGTMPEIPEPDVWETLVLKAVPKIGDNGNWYVFDIEKGEYVDTGVKASGGGSGGDVDLSNYYTKKQTEALLNGKLNAGKVDSYISDVGTVDGDFGEIIAKDIVVYDKDGASKNLPLYEADKQPVEGSNKLVTSGAVHQALSGKPSMSEVEAYIEETLLGGAW